MNIESPDLEWQPWVPARKAPGHTTEEARLIAAYPPEKIRRCPTVFLAPVDGARLTLCDGGEE